MDLDRALTEMDHALSDDGVIRCLDTRRRYAHDESEATPIVPEAVVRPTTTEQVAAVLRAASEYCVPVTARGAGTGRVGGAVPCVGGIVLEWVGDDILGIEADDLRCVVKPGVVTGDLHAAVEAEGLFYPPDPNSAATCQIGGNIATNAGGPRAFKYGVTSQWVLGLTAVTGIGEIIKVGRPTAKGVTGYDMASLLTGSEGTLAIITEATLRLRPKPQSVVTMLVFLAKQADLRDVIGAALKRRVVPRCLEFLDTLALRILKQESGGFEVADGTNAMLLVELDGDEHTLIAQVEDVGGAMIDAGAIDVVVARNYAKRERLWAPRRRMSRLMREQAKAKLSEDVVVPRTRIAELLERCNVLADTHRVRIATYGHAGDGNLHVNFLWDTDEEERRVHLAIEDLFVAVISLGGTLSGEHGIGLLKAPYLHLEQSAALIDLQCRVKQAFDPKGILNPGKIFQPGKAGRHSAC